MIKKVVVGVSNMIEALVNEGEVVESSVELFQNILRKVESLSESIQNLRGLLKR